MIIDFDSLFYPLLNPWLWEAQNVFMFQQNNQFIGMNLIKTLYTLQK